MEGFGRIFVSLELAKGILKKQTEQNKKQLWPVFNKLNTQHIYHVFCKSRQSSCKCAPLNINMTATYAEFHNG